jgi:PAS domain S-box-containing protein
MDPAARAALQRRLGWRRLARLGGAQALLARPEELSFEIIDQLDAGHAGGADELEPAQARELARLLVWAGERALARAAWSAAAHYFARALEFPLDAARERFGARFGLAQALGFAGRMAESDACFEALLAEPLEPADLALLVARRARTLVASGETRRALEFARAHIEAQGFDVPASPSLPRLLVALARAWGPVTRLDRARLLALPEVEDPRVRAAMHMLAAATSSAFSTDQQLFVHLVATHARLIARHGYHETAIDVLASFAFTQVAMGKVAAANRLIDDVIELARVRGHPTALPGTLGIRSMFVGPSLRPFRECATPMETNHRLALELGDRLGAGLLAAIGIVLHLEAGTHLAELRALFERFHAQHETWISPEFAAITGIAMHFVARVATSSERDPSEPPRVEAPPPPELDAPDISALTRHAAIVTAAWAALLLGELDEAWTCAEQIAGTFEQAMFGSWVIPRFALVDAVLVAERAQRASGGERRRLVRRLRKRLATLRRWAALGPDNFAALAELAAAELARVEGELGRATQHYERACELARAQGRAWVEVLACQRLAALAEACGWSLVAAGALVAAHRSAERWGAWALVERLEQRSDLLASPAKLDETFGSASRSQPRASSSERTRQRSTSLTLKAELVSLDLAAVLDTVQMIGEDLRLEEVITRVLGSAITNAGADRGLLLLEREGELWLVAEGHDARPRAFLDQPVSLAAAAERVPRAVIHYVSRLQTGLVSDDLAHDSRFASDPYVATAGVRSLLCMPILKQGTRIGMLLLENRLQAGAFTYERLETSRILLAQAASAIDNARLYAELARSETQWRSLVDGAPDMITLLDEQGRIEFVNHLASLGRTPASLVGQPGDVLLEPDARERWHAAFAEVLAREGPCELELALRGAGELRRVAMVRLTCLAVAGQRRRVLSIATDITERKQLEAQLREQQRIESIGTLAAGIAHEINNPVQGILNYAELLHERPDDPALVREFSLEITQESQRVAAIVRNLLAFARQEREQGFEEVDVRELIEATLSLIHAVMRRDQIRVALELPPALPRLRCRPQPIRQIIMNLVTNARDALNERYSGFDERKRIVIAAETFADATWLRLSVRDQAGGIPEQLRTRIFDPFFTTKGRDKGTGLGLSVSHGIAREHGGELRVESEVGVGSRFVLELPLAGPGTP